MTPQEKAIQLVDKMMLYSLEKEYYIDDFPKYTVNYKIKKEYAKQCALIAVNEIIDTIEYSSQADETSKIIYWDKVKEEIIKL